MGRAPCCEKIGLKKGRWTAEEDEILRKYIAVNGEGSWSSLPKNAGLLRCGKSCRLRWINYLRSDLKRGNISPEEEETIIKLHASLGNRWSVIAGHLSGRTDNEIKNYWNSHLSRKLHFSSPTDSKSSVVDIGQVSSSRRKGDRLSISARKKKNTTQNYGGRKDDINVLEESELWGKLLGEVEAVEPLDGTEESAGSTSTKTSSSWESGAHAVKEALNNGMEKGRSSSIVGNYYEEARWLDWETEGMEFRLWDGVMSDMWAPWTWDNNESTNLVEDGGNYPLLEGTPAG